MRFPLDNYIFELPEKDHVGSFLKERKFHIHEGIDLYTVNNAKVFSMADGIVIDIINFTGEKANSPWWNNTEAIIVKHDFGFILYGEIKVNKNISKGDLVKEGEHIASIKSVLKIRKNNPINMLHLELYDKYIGEPIELVKEKRSREDIFYKEIEKHGLKDPTSLLKKCKKEFKKSDLKVFLKKDKKHSILYGSLLEKFNEVDFKEDLSLIKNYDIIINNKNYFMDKKNDNIVVELSPLCSDLYLNNNSFISHRRVESYQEEVYEKLVSRILEFFY